MKIIGLAGTSGTGKTTIARHLAARGGDHIDADRVGHDVLARDRSVRDAIRERIGDVVFTAAGEIDRRALGERVFADEELLEWYNGVIHPAIRRRCGALVEASRARGAPFVVIDAALLLDAKMPFRFDLMIALRAGKKSRLERLLAKGGWSEAEIRARLSRQEGIEKSFYKADVVVDTDRDLREVLREIDHIVDDVLAG